MNDYYVPVFVSIPVTLEIVMLFIVSTCENLKAISILIKAEQHALEGDEGRDDFYFRNASRKQKR